MGVEGKASTGETADCTTRSLVRRMENATTRLHAHRVPDTVLIKRADVASRVRAPITRQFRYKFNATEPFVWSRCNRCRLCRRQAIAVIRIT